MRWVAVGLLSVTLAACAASGPQPQVPVPVRPVELGATPPATFAIAYRHIKNGEHVQARAALETLRSYEPLRDYVLYYLGLACARTGANAQALALWTELADRYPQSLLMAEGLLEQGRLYRSLGETDRARDLFHRARNAGETAVAHAARLELATLQAEAGDTSSAADELLALRRAAPRSLSGRQAKQRLLDLRRRYPELHPRGIALEDELEVLLQERDFANAVGVAEELMRITASDAVPALMRRKADAEYGAGRLNDALGTLDELVARYPRSPAAPKALFRAASLRWNKDFNEDAERDFLQLRRLYPRDPLNVDAAYALARIAYSAGDSHRAQQQFEHLAREYPGSKLAREARWRIGWIEYENRRWHQAAAAFARARETSSDDAPDAAYWRGRALERAGDVDDARAIYSRIVSETPASYYSLWAERRLGHDTDVPRAGPLRRAARRLEAPPSGAADDFHFERAQALYNGGLTTLAGAELRAFEHANEGVSGIARYLADAYEATDNYRDAMRLQRAMGADDPRVAYPLAFWEQITHHTADAAFDPLLVVALMRQESMYDPRALSPADARGLLQLLPSTAAQVAGRPVSNEELFDPDKNIELGVAHLRALLTRYQNDIFKTLAAYNGGADAVAKWDRRFPGVEPDEWVESITYRETRDYVKKVLGHYRRYQELYSATGG
jgi:soluble lytic murein transglycosylase